MNARELDEKILSELRKNGYVRRKDLLEVLKTKYANETGFSISSINRRISELYRDGEIRVIDPTEFAEYGIADGDKRAKYLVLSSYVRKKVLVDELIAKVSRGDPFEKYLAVKEVKRNLDEYLLNWVQLSHLSKCLNQDERIDTLIIEIIHEALLKQSSCIGQEEQDSLLENVYDSLVEYRLPPINENKRLLLEILGFFSAETVIDLLKIDLEYALHDKQWLPKEDEGQTKSWIKDLYHSKYLVHIFEIYNAELLRLMWDYNEKGKREGDEDKRKIALLIDGILDYAAENKRKAVYYDYQSCGVKK